ncbi:NAD(P)H-hydrate epimerase [Brevibacterium sp. BRM-1]|uniref:NAD(P)H-hydrate epimerase n=1 Tax=Brevibacterium sp. BRM-1 TaxID=2999062 RepID=UPI00227F0347|nr:NAD(P)H-hydrate epimerase [Brevibacterium sp. BRM-1]WAL40174.1 NAD(P)H-hydrate epimerase [Brevibacterium sp. BRM-1]
MRLGYTAADVRAAEEPLLAAGAPLMARAAAGLAAVCRRELVAAHGRVAGARIAVLAGAGNNGGDALFAAAALAARGAAVTVIEALGRPHADGLAAVRAAGAQAADTGAARAALADADLVLDGILGTGARTGLPAPLADLLREWQTDTGARGVLGRTQLTIAVDVPTGVDATTGERGEVWVEADTTVTFGALKSGLLLPGGADAAGRVELVDIGLDMGDAQPRVQALDEDDIAPLFPFPRRGDHKYTRGVLGLVAGSDAYPGAAALAGVAAIATGVGMLRLVGPRRVADAVLAITPEAVAGRGRVQAWALGSGAPAEDEMRASLADARESGLPVALDAGALALVEGPLGHPAVLTPHAGELAELLGRLEPGDAPDRAAIEADPVAAATAAARATGAVVLLKGPRTVIARPDGSLVAPAPGPAALATAGTGDVLLGVLGALLATTAEHEPVPDLALVAGLAVLLHSAAGHATTHASGLPAALEARIVALRESEAGR